MRTIAPNTRCRHATTSAAIDRRRVAFIAWPARYRTTRRRERPRGTTAHATSIARRAGAAVEWRSVERSPGAARRTDERIANCAITQQPSGDPEERVDESKRHEAVGLRMRAQIYAGSTFAAGFPPISPARYGVRSPVLPHRCVRRVLALRMEAKRPFSAPRDARADLGPSSGGPAELPRKLGLWSAVAVVAGITIGSGIFRTPAGVADRLHRAPCRSSSSGSPAGSRRSAARSPSPRSRARSRRQGASTSSSGAASEQLPAFLFGWGRAGGHPSRRRRRGDRDDLRRSTFCASSASTRASRRTTTGSTTSRRSPSPSFRSSTTSACDGARSFRTRRRSRSISVYSSSSSSRWWSACRRPVVTSPRRCPPEVCRSRRSASRSSRCCGRTTAGRTSRSSRAR